MSKMFTGPIPKQPPALKAPKPLKSKSKDAAARDARYAVERPEFLSAHPRCEACWGAGCTQIATEVHHMGGRSPSVFFRKSWWLASCAHCHHLITTNPAEAFDRGLSFHRNEVG